ncbi:butyrophilin subfamily 1 member A1 [Ictidomys tridecemlineatus]|uniref:butyrophilin-like protein 10 isoform X2 n=1 Tax=Ictidomys tridecemlineatus TaxID=43179 RepID=UPI001A9E0615|nr:butyrophilin-like protein 10 isoform X2 [Ictidomys tridecemlineatus]
MSPGSRAAASEQGMAKTRCGRASLLRCTVAFLFLQLPPPGNGRADFQVQGPHAPVLALVGEDAELSCRLVPSISTEGMELRWYRNQSSPAVLVHRNGEDVHQEQMVEYQGRTSFVSDHVARGEATLRIHNVTLFDNGTYHCLFKEGTSSNQATLWLTVAVPISSAPLSRPPLTEWQLSLSLALAALGFLVSGVLCCLGKQQKKSSQTLLEETEQEETAQRPQASSTKAELFHVSPSLDPDTASPKLMVSEDQKSVKRLLFDQYLLPNSKRFDQDPCVLAQERFSAGRYYWEVEVGDRQAWILGVCLENIDREGWIPKSPQHGLWAVELYKKRFWALSYPRTRLSPSQPLQQLGILLDWDAGEISFYNATKGSLVYRFSELSFSGPLQPFFCLWTHDPRPLTICSVARETQEDTSPPWRPVLSPRGPGDFC